LAARQEKDFINTKGSERMNLDNIKMRKENKICYITINRPKAHNSLNKKTLNELEKVIEKVKNDQNILVAILTGSGEKAFVAGADIREMKDFTDGEAEQFSFMGQKIFDKIENCNKPFIAAVNGHALGGGMELALACDIRIASKDAVFGQPEVGLGIIPGFGGTQRLTSLIGKGLSKEYILTGRYISAQKALEVGLINHLIENEELINKSEDIADEIISNSPVAVSRAKKAINFFDQSFLDHGLKKESEIFGSCFDTEDQEIGMKAFLNRKKPIFKGE